MKRDAMRVAGKAVKVSAAVEAVKVFERPTGYYVRLAGSREEFGPFRTIAEALGTADLEDVEDFDDRADEADTADLGYECAFPPSDYDSDIEH